MNSEDRQAIEACLQGEVDAFAILVRRYQDRLYNTVLRVVDNHEDAWDVVQESFLNAYQSLASFKGDAEFFTWLYRIAFNAAVSQKRKKRATISLEQARTHDGKSVDPADDSEQCKPSDALERHEEHTAVHRALAQLSVEHRSVLIMKDLDGMKYEEIAEIMDIPIGTVRSRLHRARLELRDILAQDEMTEYASMAKPENR